MRGIEDACQVVAAALGAAMPAKVAELVDRYGLDPAAAPGTPELPNTLTAPALIATTERRRLESEEWPAILIVGLNTRSIRPLGPELDPPHPAAAGDPWHAADPPPAPPADPRAGAPRYAITYRVRVYVYVRGQEFEDTDLARKRLLLGAREILLADVELDPDAGGAVINPLSLAESFSEVEPLDSARTVAAAYLELDVTLEEVAAGIPGQPVRATTLIVDVAPPHPALD